MNYTEIGNNYIAIVKDDPKDRIEIEIGDSKQLDFKPQVKLTRWDNEINVSFRLLDDELTGKKPKLEDEKIKVKGNTKEAHFYDTGTGFKFEIILKSKPDTNILTFSLNFKSIVFHYQQELTQEEKDMGAVRPNNVTGSYAVYTSENKVNLIGGKVYGTGKVGHIYRPRAVDNDGNWVLGELNITINSDSSGTMTKTIPQDFLDKAAYPIKIN